MDKLLEKKINKEYKQGNVKSAIELCQLGLQNDPTNADLHVRLGDLFLAWHLDIYNSCFPIEYFPKSVGMILTYLCTYDNHLTQGSPTSAYISNLVMKEFDEELGNWCNLRNISYTRYSDDMTFSGAFNPSELRTKVRKMLYKVGLELNNDKIHIVYKSSSQNVTGIVVNEKMQVNVKYRNKIRQEIYYIKKFGLSSHLKKCDINIDSKRYLNILYGKVLYVLQINENDIEFIKYRQFIENLKRQCKS